MKHTVREFSESESAKVATDLGMPQAPKRMIATIRQTMSRGCLSTREPLRVLHVGSPAAQKDIVYKLSSAIWTSGTTDGSGKVAYRNNEGVYNIVPHLVFRINQGARDPAHGGASGYQIKVENCTSAEEIVFEGQFFPADTVYSLATDQDKMLPLSSLQAALLNQQVDGAPHCHILRDGERR